ncbi:MAG: Ig-like domain repeat protein [Candidatus Acidiferrum sp.]
MRHLFLRSLSGFLLASAMLVWPGLRTEAQTASVPVRITQAVNEKSLLVLKGNVHPLARSEFDQGAVSDGLPLHRMLLLLKRSPEQEAALQALLDEQQDKSSPNYHAWLTPAQFGRQFGPADADIQTVTSWLQSQGFQIDNVSAGRTVIEFSGNAVQVRSAFHTEIHSYLVNGETHTANNSDPQIPAALAPVVAGPVSLNNFPVKSFIHTLGPFEKSIKTGEITPLFTFPGCRSGNCYAVGPADFRTIYNTAPLLTGTPKIDGTGETIAIVGESNINVQDVTDFRKMFGLPQNFSTANIILNGPDPGLNGSEGESDLDVEWAGAVAPGATIDFVTSESTETTAGIFLSAAYIVDNNLAGVMSESFGGCEQLMGTLNQFHNTLWEQAAAQGITVMVSAGDGGSAGCDNFNTQQTATRGLAVSGFASTPYNVSVGGTDFDDAGIQSQYWNTAPTSIVNLPVPASALSYIHEVPWNDSCAANGITGCTSGNFLDIVAGSGGVSTLYPKPSWQSGAGVPNDNHRDLPDISLFASIGSNSDSFYIMCQSDALPAPGTSCNLTNFRFTFQGVGGTSASSPAFAGIMALVDQKYGRQGNANYVLYALAKMPGASCNSNGTTLPPSTCTFYDITKGNNSVPCTGGTANCSSKVASTNGVLVTTANPSTPAYTATPGYDPATGLGSVNAASLVSNWSSVKFLASATTLNATVNGSSVTSITGITHGTAIGVSSTVAAGQGVSGTPTGQVALIATPNPNPPPGSPSGSLGVDLLSLTGGTATGSGVILPGGTYNLTAHYQGDGTFGASDSTPPISVNITAEPSKTLISIPVFDPTSGRETGNAPTSLVYGSPYIARIDVGNANASVGFPSTTLCTSPNCPTGTITWTDALNGGAPLRLDGGSFVLNSSGYTEDQPIQLSGGSHLLSAAYSGDASYAASSGTYSLTVVPAATSVVMTVLVGNVTAGNQFPVIVYGNTQAESGIAPTGTITFLDGAAPLGSPVAIIGTPAQFGSTPGFSSGRMYLTVATPGSHSLSVKYSGDSNYSASSYGPTMINVLNPVVANLMASPTTVNYGSTITISGTVDTMVPASNTALKPTGAISLGGTADGQIVSAVTTSTMADPSGNWEIVTTATITPSNSEFLVLEYAGDSNYAAATAESSPITVITPDFSLAPNPNSVTVTAGQTGSTTIAVAPASNIGSTVNLKCTSINLLGTTCVLAPSSVNLSDQVAGSSTLTVSVAGPSNTNMAELRPRSRGPKRFSSAMPGGWMKWPYSAAFLLVLILLVPRRRLRLATWLALTSVVIVGLGCGGGNAQPVLGGGGGGGGPVTTSTSITASSTKIASGSQLTFTAKVTSSKPVTGTLNFMEMEAPGVGYGLAPPVPVVNGTAQLQAALYLVGTHQIVAQYTGDSQNNPSQSATLNIVSTGTSFVQVTGTTGPLSHILNVNVTVQ